MRFLATVVWLILSFAWLAACEIGAETIQIPPLDAAQTDESAPFICTDESSKRCVGNSHMSCVRYEEFLEVVEVDCTERGQVCHPERVCIVCTPGSTRCEPCDPGDDCDPNQVQACNDEGTAWEDVEVCDLAGGFACYDGMCAEMCERAELDRSYVGCEFYAVDLDNAAINDRNNAAVQQFAVAVANPLDVPVDVTVEINDAPYGEAPEPRLLAEVTVPPGSLEVFALPQREVDGSSDGALNDGTHSALSSNAFRIHSSHPLTAYQFNPLENVNVFSNDASLLIPTSAIGDQYTVVSWPQTIGHSDDPANDFDLTSDREDLRAFLTVVGTEPDTEVVITLGSQALNVVGLDDDRMGPTDRLERTIGPYDVINLESEGLNVDFTGSIVSANKPVTVFVGSEASDVPRFGTYATRQCCADHLEEQLFPDSAAGTQFSVARMPPRTRALSQAARDGQTIDIAIADEPEWVRVLAVGSGVTTVMTTLPEPDDLIELEPGEDVILRADQDFEMSSSLPISVLQALPSQGVTGIPRQFPGGDPSIIAVPPIQQYRDNYIFLTPDKYAFDFVVITAESIATVLLDGENVEDRCDGPTPADGMRRRDDEPAPERVVYRCQLSFPEITSGPDGETFPGDQDDGVHTVVSDREVGIVVYGFDRFVSYAYVGGLDLDILQ
jgi:hypothetical protein